MNGNQPKRLSPALSSAPKRLVAAGLLLILTVLVLAFTSQSWSFLVDGSPYNLLFVSAALLLVLGAYVSEPYFSRPVDVVVNAVALLVALLGVVDKDNFVGYWILLVGATVLLIVGIVVMVSTRFAHTRVVVTLFRVLTGAGRSTVLFSLLYFLAIVTFFTSRAYEFWILLTLLVVLVSRGPVARIVNWSFSLFGRDKSHTRTLLGQVTRRENPGLVSVTNVGAKSPSQGMLVLLPTGRNQGYLGVVLNTIFRHSSAEFLVSILSRDELALSYDTRDGSVSRQRINQSLRGGVFEIARSDLEASVDELISGVAAARDPSLIVGFVGPKSTIEEIVVEIPESFATPVALELGTVVETEIRGEKCLFQVVEAVTQEEMIGDRDSRGFISFSAHSLGKYDSVKRELNSVGWLPNIHSPVFLRVAGASSNSDLTDVIGVLPGTDLAIPLHNPNELVTHNTAILGILGIGKSSLSFEAIQKTLALTGAKVVIIDITNEYGPELARYVHDGIQLDDEDAFNSINARYSHIQQNGGAFNYEKSGNIAEYREAIRADLIEFLFGSNQIPSSLELAGETRIRVYNPDFHKASKGEKVGYNVIVTDMSQAEKTRVIAEQLFWILRELGPSRGQARVLLVLEEAHSLVPEWNSTANDGDRAAVNGTAKVLLQGRKYGYGFLLITQRTAHVSKSILNQCNSIFAMRIFDDTGKNFLENYVGGRYAQALPSLEERHAVIVGRAFRLKQPVIAKLNDAATIRIE